MKARSIITQTCYDPDTLAVLFAAFDAAWAEISDQFPEPAQAESVRSRLAHAVLTVAEPGERNIEAIKQSALAVFALAYRTQR